MNMKITAFNCLLGCLVALAVVCISVATTTVLNRFMQPEPASVYVIDAGAVAKIFIERHGEEMAEEDFKQALVRFDRAVTEEAETIFQRTGIALVNKNHMLAGGVDVTADFAEQVMLRWGQQQ